MSQENVKLVESALAFQSAGSSVADVGQQLGDWLKRVRSTGDENDNDRNNG